MPVQLSNSYQFKITIKEIIPENIKSSQQNGNPQSCAQAFLGRNTNYHNSRNKNQNKLQIAMQNHGDLGYVLCDLHDL